MGSECDYCFLHPFSLLLYFLLSWAAKEALEVDQIKKTLDKGGLILTKRLSWF